MSEPNKSTAGLRERLRTKRWEGQERKAERMDRARREGARPPEDVRRAPGSGHGTTDFGAGSWGA